MTSLKDKAYGIVRDRIINCVYPPGSMLVEKDIIDEIEVSRTPFREAINALSKEGLVEIYPRKGVFVKSITLKDINDLYTVREIIEPFSLKFAMSNIPSGILRQAYENMDRLKNTVGNGSISEEESLHKLILRYVDNDMLERIMDDIYVQNHRLSVLCNKDEANLLETKKEHLEIASHMLANDTAAAVTAMENHIKSSKQRALDCIMSSDSRINIG
jgi:DNA-binding GntR family transcriptional regulator